MDTRGHLWTHAHALDTGIPAGKGFLFKIKISHAGFSGRVILFLFFVFFLMFFCFFSFLVVCLEVFWFVLESLLQSVLESLLESLLESV